MNKDTQRYLKVKFEHEELEEIIANNPIINEWRMAYVEKVVPPTEQQLCEALSEHFSFDNNIESIKYHKYLAKSQRKGGQILIGWKSGGFSNVLNYLATETEDAPHLITMVGKFYEGVKR